jgi:hypothetical protein
VRFISKASVSAFLIVTMLTFNMFAAQNQMGTSKPVVGTYGQAVGAEIRIFFNDATAVFLASSTLLTLSARNMS